MTDRPNETLVKELLDIVANDSENLEIADTKVSSRRLWVMP